VLSVSVGTALGLLPLNGVAEKYITLQTNLMSFAEKPERLNNFEH
jgi:hypothetical protein